MRRTTTTIVAAAALAMVSISGAAAATRVDGTHFDRSNIILTTQSCIGQEPASDVVQPKIVKSNGGLGARSLSWDVTGTGSQSGPLLHISSPSALEVVSTDIRWISGGVSGGLVVRFHPADGGVWRGYKALPEDTTWGWHKVSLNVSATTFDWRHFTDGVQDDSAGSLTLRTLVADHGGDADGADVGFAFGCDGRDFVLDRFKVKTDGKAVTYDYEGFATRAHLTNPQGKRKPITLIAGGEGRLMASLRDVTGVALPEKVSLERKVGHKFKKVRSLDLGADGVVRTSVAPVSAASYRIRFVGNGDFDSSVSKPTKVRVHTNVRAHLRRGSVIQGRPFTVSGRFWPGRSATLWLQKFVNHEWKTAQRFRSAKDGAYSTSMRASRVGKSYWRIWNPAGGGNLAGRSSAMKLVTKPKPKPPHHGGGGSTPTPTNPEPPTNDPVQPPPPPTGPQ